jgi:glycosyltransferase involved in cell wall biosynthesis
MISVITATYNHAPFLEGAVASLQAQSCQDFEHVVVDDGSTDATPAILDRLAQSARQPMRVFRTPNRGLAAALNLGLARAQGDLVCFLDSDDELPPDHLEYMLATLGSHDFVLGRFELVNCTGTPDPVVADFFNPGQVIPIQAIEYGTGLFFGKRSVFVQLDGFRHVNLSDTDFFMRMKAAGYDWVKADRASYRWFFGRVPNNMAVREIQEIKELQENIK